jgi:hypothetical protein
MALLLPKASPLVPPDVPDETAALTAAAPLLALAAAPDVARTEVPLELPDREAEADPEEEEAEAEAPETVETPVPAMVLPAERI